MLTKFLVKDHYYFIKYGTSNIKNNNDSDICLNWWPISTDECVETNKNIINPLCKVCANWLPDIEDILKDPSTIKRSKCINEWVEHNINK
jgi:hypothetical protein